jgi:hypothetical protein
MWKPLTGSNNKTSPCDVFINLVVADKKVNVFDAVQNNFGYGNYVLKYDGSKVEILSGMNSFPSKDIINANYVDTAENVYVAGKFKNSLNNRYVAKWDGTAWNE